MKKTFRILGTLALCALGPLASIRATEPDPVETIARTTAVLADQDIDAAASPDLWANVQDAVSDGRWYSGIYCVAALGCF